MICLVGWWRRQEKELEKTEKEFRRKEKVENATTEKRNLEHQSKLTFVHPFFPYVWTKPGIGSDRSKMTGDDVVEAELELWKQHSCIVLDADIAVNSPSKKSHTSIKDRILFWGNVGGDLAGHTFELTFSLNTNKKKNKALTLTILPRCHVYIIRNVSL